MRLLIFSSLFLLFSTMSPNVALANDYNIAGMTCIPSGVDYTNLTFFHDDNRVQHTPTNTGTITIYCAIPFTLTTPTRMDLVYVDETTSGATFVEAAYSKMHKTTGVLTVIATASSEDGTQDGALRTVNAGFTDTYDASQYFYFVTVSIVRDNVSAGAAF